MKLGNKLWIICLTKIISETIIHINYFQNQNHLILVTCHPFNLGNSMSFPGASKSKRQWTQNPDIVFHFQWLHVSYRPNVGTYLSGTRARFLPGTAKKHIWVNVEQHVLWMWSGTCCECGAPHVAIPCAVVQSFQESAVSSTLQKCTFLNMKLKWVKSWSTVPGSSN